MKKFIVNENDSGQRLDKFIMKSLPELPKSLMYKMIRKKDIKINGKRCEISTKINCGDVISVYVAEKFCSTDKDKKFQFLDAQPNIDVVYEDDNILIINKPAELAVHCDNEQETDTLINRVKKYLYDSGAYNPETENSFAPALCSRLDKNTIGLVTAAKNAVSLRLVNEAIRNGNVTKIYHCITSCPPKQNDIISAYHVKNEKNNMVKITSEPSEYTKPIKTGYKVLRSDGKLSLLEVTLYTGRTHQIRAHLAFIGCPVLGDNKYGDLETNRQYNMFTQALCAYSLKFNFDENSPLAYLNDKIFEAPVPGFEKLV